MKLKKNLYVNSSIQCDINSLNNTYYYPLIINKEPLLFKSSYYIILLKFIMLPLLI